MGLMVKWIIFFPYYGPALSAINANNIIFPHLFTLAHILGLLYSASIHIRSSDSRFVNRFNKLAACMTALFTVGALYNDHHNFPILTVILFVLMGLTSGWISGRWMTWFSSADTTSKRGSILGKTIGITYSLLLLNTLVMAIPNQGIKYSILLSASSVLIGSLLICQLPFIPKRSLPVPIRLLMPPLDLLLFGVFAYATVSLIYRSILTNHLQLPALSLLVAVPYILTGLLLGKWSDKNDRYYFAILALLVIGLGFLVQTISSTHAVSTIFVQMLILTGLICLHLFYWLSLVDRQNISYAPFPFVVGVSIELISCAAVFTIVPLLSPHPDTLGRVVGVTGVVFILGGFFVTTFTNYRAYTRLLQVNKPSNDIEQQNIPIPQIIHSVKMPVFYYFHHIDRKIIEKTLTDNFNLTRKETEIAYQLLVGYNNNEIAKLLYISPNTLRYHIKNIYSKIGTSSRKEASVIVLSSIQNSNDISEKTYQIQSD